MKSKHTAAKPSRGGSQVEQGHSPDGRAAWRLEVGSQGFQEQTKQRDRQCGWVSGSGIPLEVPE